MPTWVDIVVKLTPAFVTLVVGGIAALIAFFQFRLARDRLRFDLFSKRLEAYEKLQEFFASVYRHGTVVDSALPLLAEARYRSRFIFGSEIAAWFETLWEKAVKIHTLHKRISNPESLPGGPERTEVCQQEHDLVGWMLKEIQSSSNRYVKYLHFR